MINVLIYRQWYELIDVNLLKIQKFKYCITAIGYVRLELEVEDSIFNFDRYEYYSSGHWTRLLGAEVRPYVPPSYWSKYDVHLFYWFIRN